MAVLPAGWSSNAASASPWLTGKWLAMAAGLLAISGIWWGQHGGDPNNGPAQSGIELAAQAGAPIESIAETPDEQVGEPGKPADRVALDAPVEEESGWLPFGPDTRFYTLRGFCFNEAREPVPDMSVTAFDLNGTPSVKTDRDGRFALHITDLSRGAGPLGIAFGAELAEDVRIVFEVAGHRTPFQRIDLLSEVEIDLGVVECETAPHTIRGRVLDSVGEPANLAFVALVPNAPQQVNLKELFWTSVAHELVYPIGGLGFLQTNAAGEFAIRGVPKRNWRVAVFHNGHDGFLTDLFELGEGAIHDLGALSMRACEQEQSIRGRVLMPDGQFASEVFVGASAFYANQTMSSMPPVLTDAQGRFAFPVPPATATCLDAVCSAGAVTVEGVEPGATEIELRLSAREQPTLEPSIPDQGVLLKGEVMLLDQAVAGAWIGCYALRSSEAPGALNSSPIRSAFASTRSGTDGRFEIRVPKTARFVLKGRAGSATSLASADVIVESADEVREPMTLVLPLERTGRINGSVDASGSSTKPGARVIAVHENGKRRTTSVGMGLRFELENLEPGSWRLVHESRSKAERETWQVVHVHSSQTASVLVRIDAGISCDVSGRFLIDGKAPRTEWTPGAMVDLERIKMSKLQSSGQFQLDPSKAGELRLQFLSRGQAIQAYVQHAQLAPGPNEIEVNVVTGSLALSELPLPEKVDTTGGVPLSVILTWTGESGLKWSAYLYQGKGGELTLDQVPAGTVQLRHHPKGSSSPPENLPVAAEIEIRAGERTSFSCPPR